MKGSKPGRVARWFTDWSCTICAILVMPVFVWSHNWDAVVWAAIAAFWSNSARLWRKAYREVQDLLWQALNMKGVWPR